MATEPIAIDQGSYYTDGSRLYYIIRLDAETVLAENCSTLFTANIPYDVISDGWTRLSFAEIRHKAIKQGAGK